MLITPFIFAGGDFGCGLGTLCLLARVAQRQNHCAIKMQTKIGRQWRWGCQVITAAPEWRLRFNKLNSGYQWVGAPVVTGDPFLRAARTPATISRARREDGGNVENFQKLGEVWDDSRKAEQFGNARSIVKTPERGNFLFFAEDGYGRHSSSSSTPK
jgi:hypothetical protein